MEHINVYTDLYLARLKQTDPNYEQLQAILQHTHNINLEVHQVEMMMQEGYKPKPSQLIPHLLERGYSPTFVATLLKTTKQNVSYHKNNRSKYEYVNDVLRFHLEGVIRYKKNKQIIWQQVNRSDEN